MNKILFHGNCQSMALASSLAKVATACECLVMATPLLWEIDEASVRRVREFASTADLIFAMPISSTYKEGLSTDDIIAISDCPVVIHPNVHFTGLFPTYDYARSVNGSHIGLYSRGNPTSDYLCYLTYSCFSLGIDVEQCFNLLSGLGACPLVLTNYDAALNELLRRESIIQSDVGHIGRCSSFRVTPFLGVSALLSNDFYSINHPSPSFLKRMLLGLLRTAATEFSLEFSRCLSVSVAMDDFTASEIASPILPVYSFVAHSLGESPDARPYISYTDSRADLRINEFVAASYQCFDRLETNEKNDIEGSPLFRAWTNYVRDSIAG